MKPESTKLIRFSNKRKNCFESDNGKARKQMCLLPLMPDMIQDNIWQKYILTGEQTISTLHCKQWPIGMHSVDGINVSRQNASRNPCSKCLSGQSGHWRHIQ